MEKSYTEMMVELSEAMYNKTIDELSAAEFENVYNEYYKLKLASEYAARF